MVRSAITALLRREQARISKETGRRRSLGPGVEISIVLCDDPFIRSLNLEYRGLDKPTDVLSFAQGDPDEGWGSTLGDVVISLDTADRQAAAAGWTLDSEVVLLAVHGVLHLLGYDDATTEGAVEMRDKTAVILADCNIVLPPAMAHPYFIEYN